MVFQQLKRRINVTNLLHISPPDRCERIAPGELLAEIAVLNRLPEPVEDALCGRYAGILAHELFHVWQIRTGGIRDRADSVFREGGAQYVQHRMLEDRGLEAWAARLLDNPDPIYGDGLRRFRRLARAVGDEKALALSATTDRFPRTF